MTNVTDFLPSKVIILPDISIPVNLTDFNLLTNHRMQKELCEVKKYKNVMSPPFKGT